MIKILFVCHGNICRSPMAEFIMKNIVKNHRMENSFEIASAATSSEELGNPVYPPAREELAKHGIGCEGKRAVQLTKSDYDKYDYLLCMDNTNMRNARRIIGSDPDDKLRLLLSFTGDAGSIADPWYFGNFDRTYSDIVRGCNAFLKYLGF